MLSILEVPYHHDFDLESKQCWMSYMETVAPKFYSNLEGTALDNIACSIYGMY